MAATRELNAALSGLRAGLDGKAASSGESWRPVDIAALLQGGIEYPQPSVLHRTDGQGLLYPGKLHAFIGPTESLKSMTTQIATAEVLNAGGRAAYVDFETEAAYVVGNLIALGAPQDVLTDPQRFFYVQPVESSESGLHVLLDAVGDLELDITVVDGVDQALSLDGREPNSRKDVAQWRTSFLLPLSRKTVGPLAMIDHPTKNASGGDAAGAGNKKNLADVQINFEVVTPFGEGTTGVVKLSVGKDRPGGLRQHAVGKQLATLEITSTGKDQPITYELRPPEPRVSPDEFRPTNLMQKVSEFLEGSTEPASQQVVEKNVRGNADYKRKALARLVVEGYVARAPGKGNAQLHTSVMPFREADDPPASSLVPTSSRPRPGRTQRDLVSSSPPYGDEDEDEVTRHHNEVDLVPSCRHTTIASMHGVVTCLHCRAEWPATATPSVSSPASAERREGM